jgi:hypothetical protein
MLERKRFGLFLFNQVIGGLAVILQNWAVFLIPFSFLAFVNALEATKYFFLLIFTLFLSFKFPEILKEEFSYKTLFQKFLAVFLILFGLFLLS